ncbi:tetratricopeptide repeat protein [Wolbachia endosymbiont of Drosophila innubila]|uniref:tetratricopeptide repeat protein n=1 Tax=Wolbachia endosymbiont of Drosophila innubila TaxID=282263 RepID=UPI001F47102D|nr:tetratricopeptide repeat protein [Wolbachia endosymbiont of Drosophila innubila]UID81788.1 tetratricopeptide repeat protein [Wolbachia endosymbiont of Drosophila innubila]
MRPEDPDILLALGKAKHNLGIATNGSNEKILPYEEAIKLYEEAKELRPKILIFYWLLGKAKHNLGIATNGSNERILLYEEAIKLYEEAKGLRRRS